MHDNNLRLRGLTYAIPPGRTLGFYRTLKSGGRITKTDIRRGFRLQRFERWKEAGVYSEMLRIAYEACGE